jgi:lipoate-protein ligase A
MRWHCYGPHSWLGGRTWRRPARSTSRPAGSAVLRLYRWDPWCLSFGRHEPALGRYGRGPVEALGVDVVRRPTGGRAVWHARELTYAIAAPAALGSLPEVYRLAHEMLGEAIAGLGGAAKLAPAPARPPPPGSRAGFAPPARGEVLIEGRKSRAAPRCASGTPSSSTALSC